MVILVTIIHVLVCLFLIAVVLLQSGKAADLAGAFGGMGSQTVFGPRGAATALSKATTISAVLFMFTSLTLSILSTGTAGGGATPSLIDDITAPAETKSAPATPGTPASPITPTGEVQVIPSQQTPAPAPAPAK